jgi:hypothetical protein
MVIPQFLDNRRNLPMHPPSKKYQLLVVNSFHDEDDNRKKSFYNFVIVHMKNPILVGAKSFQR